MFLDSLCLCFSDFYLSQPSFPFREALTMRVYHYIIFGQLYGPDFCRPAWVSHDLTRVHYSNFRISPHITMHFGFFCKSFLAFCGRNFRFSLMKITLSKLYIISISIFLARCEVINALQTSSLPCKADVGTELAFQFLQCVPHAALLRFLFENLSLGFTGVLVSRPTHVMNYFASFWSGASSNRFRFTMIGFVDHLDATQLMLCGKLDALVFPVIS